MTSVWGELRRRNVIKVAIAYVIVGWLLLQVSETLVPALHLPEWFHSGVAFLIILGFPIALIFAWAFELTPKGIRKEKDVDRGQSITQVTGRKLDYIIIAVLVLALGYFAFDKFVLDPSRDAELVQTATEAVTERAAETADKSIAVLAFADLSPEGDQVYFSDGISEELLNVLAKIPGLRVAARTSSFQFKDENRDIVDIGKQLNVALVLEGSVRKAGPQLRITAQLVDARSGFHIWSETYDRELENIFAVQDEISAAIVGSLQEHLGLQVEAAPRVIAAANTEAHDAYLRGRYLMVQRTLASVEGAVREFEKAIEFDPDYALAHAELAIATLFLPSDVFRGLTQTEAIARAVPHVKQAMTLDPTVAESHAATGFLFWNQVNPEEALKHFRHAIRINPNYAIVHNWIAMLLSSDLGRYNEAIAAYEMAVRLDPLSIAAITNYVRELIVRNRLVEADRELEKLATIAPSFHAFLRGERTSLGGKWANGALGELDALLINPDRGTLKNSLALGFAHIGLEKEALDIAEDPRPDLLSLLGKHGDAVMTAAARLAEDPISLTARYELAIALAGAGDFNRARPILEDLWERSGGRITGNSLFFDATSAAALIVIRRDAGEEAKVGELVAVLRDNVRRYHEAGMTEVLFFSVDYEEGIAAYLSGESERGLALIAKAAENGYFIRPNEAYLQALYDDPGFTPILASQEARQVRERERFLAIVCTDNLYAAVWQPAAETCEPFAVAGGN